MGFLKAEQVINRQQCCAGQVSPGSQGNRGVLALSGVIHCTGIFQGRGSIQELTYCCKERGSEWGRFVPPTLLSQIYTDTISVSVSYLFPFNLDESSSVVIAF